MSDFTYVIVLALVGVTSAAVLFAAIVSFLQAAGWTYCEGYRRFVAPRETFSDAEGITLCRGCYEACEPIQEELL